MTPKKARRLLAAGASIHAVMLDASISQKAIAERAGSDQPRVAVVLVGKVGATAPAHATARRIYEAAADLLGIEIDEVVRAVHGTKAVVGG